MIKAISYFAVVTSAMLQIGCAPLKLETYYKPNPISEPKLQVPVKTNVFIKNLEAPYYLSEESLGMMIHNEIDQVFENKVRSPSQKSDINLEVHVNEFTIKSQPWGLIWFPLIYLGAPMNKISSSSDVNITVYNSTNSEVISTYQRTQKLSKWQGLYYGYKYSNMTKEAFIPYSVLHQTFDGLKSELLLDKEKLNRHWVTKDIMAMKQEPYENKLTGVENINKKGTSDSEVYKKFDPKTGSFTYTVTKENETDQIRKDWMEKGGSMEMFSFSGGYNYMQSKGEGYNFTGNGFNISATRNALNLKMPDYNSLVHNWSSFVGGLTAGFNYNVATSDFETGTATQRTEIEIANLNAILNLGFTLGLGRYLTPDNWKGVAIEFTYRPSVGMSQVFMEDFETEPEWDYNLAGFGVDFNFSNFRSSLEKIAPKAQSKLGFFFLPQTKKTPFMFNITYGLVWYDKKQ